MGFTIIASLTMSIGAASPQLITNKQHMRLNVHDIRRNILIRKLRKQVFSNADNSSFYFGMLSCVPIVVALSVVRLKLNENSQFTAYSYRKMKVIRIGYSRRHLHV
jgi:hypothetical protein